jgi:hypothetical protein
MRPKTRATRAPALPFVGRRRPAAPARDAPARRAALNEPIRSILPETDMAGQLEFEFDGAPVPAFLDGRARGAPRRASVLLQPSRRISLRVRARSAHAARAGSGQPQDALSGPEDAYFDAWRNAAYDAQADGAVSPD